MVSVAEAVGRRLYQALVDMNFHPVPEHDTATPHPDSFSPFYCHDCDNCVNINRFSFPLLCPSCSGCLLDDLDADMEYENFIYGSYDSSDQTTYFAVDGASDAAINALPVVTVTEAFLDDDPRRVCAVCLDQFLLGSKVKQLPCSHVYHGDCIKLWLIKCNSCPQCRSQIPAATYDPFIAPREDWPASFSVSYYERWDMQEDLFPEYRSDWADWRTFIRDDTINVEWSYYEPEDMQAGLFPVYKSAIKPFLPSECLSWEYCLPGESLLDWVRFVGGDLDGLLRVPGSIRDEIFFWAQMPAKGRKRYRYAANPQRRFELPYDGDTWLVFLPSDASNWVPVDMKESVAQLRLELGFPRLAAAVVAEAGKKGVAEDGKKSEAEDGKKV